MNTIRFAHDSLQFSGLEELRWKARRNKKVGALKKVQKKVEKKTTQMTEGTSEKTIIHSTAAKELSSKIWPKTLFPNFVFIFRPC